MELLADVCVVTGK